MGRVIELRGRPGRRPCPTPSSLPAPAARRSSSCGWRVEVAGGRVDLLVPFSGVKLTPEQARDLARALVKGATDAELMAP